MKKCLSIVLLTILLCGCSVKSGEVTNHNIVNVKLKIILSDKTPSSFETAAEEYQKEHSNIEFQIKRISNKDNYNQIILSEMNKDTLTAFSLNNLYDLKYFENDLESLPSSLTKKDITLATPISLYGCGIYYNKQMLEAAGVNEDLLLTKQGLDEAISKINSKKNDLNLNEALTSEIDLEQFASLVGFKEGSIDKSILNYFSLKNKVKEDPAIELNNRKAAIYLGSGRYIKQIFTSDIKSSIKFCSLPYITINDKLYESDYLSITKGASDPQKRAIYDFLEYLKHQNNYSLTPFTQEPNNEIEKEILNNFKENKLKEGGTSNLPYSWEMTFKEEEYKLKTGDISFEEFDNKLKDAFIRGKNIS